MSTCKLLCNTNYTWQLLAVLVPKVMFYLSNIPIRGREKKIEPPVLYFWLKYNQTNLIFCFRKYDLQISICFCCKFVRHIWFAKFATNQTISFIDSFIPKTGNLFLFLFIFTEADHKITLQIQSTNTFNFYLHLINPKVPSFFTFI